MTRIPNGVTMNPTVDKRGYWDKPTQTVVKTRPLSAVEYVVFHSAEGWASNIMNIQNNPTREASWPSTVLLDGTRWDHYDIEDVCWINGNKTANIKGFGVEFEGVKGTPITDAQVKAGAGIYRALLAVCPNLKGAVLGEGFEEHRRVSGGATTCPNDRIRWDDIAALVTLEGDSMTPEQEAKLDQMYLWMKEVWEYRQQNNDQHAVIVSAIIKEYGHSGGTVSAKAIADELAERLRD